MESFWQDIRFGARMLGKNPGFTAIAVLVLGLGIGANAAILSLVNAFLLRPMAGEKPDELVSCYSKNTKTSQYRAFSYPEYCDLRARADVFSSLLAHNLTTIGIGEGDTVRRTFADVISSNYFSTYGVQILRGREFLPAEERPGSAVPVAIVSDNYWQKEGRDPNLLGKTIRINGRPFTIVGIAPEGFTGVFAVLSTEVWLPLGVSELVDGGSSASAGARSLQRRDNFALFLIGRLQAGMTPATAGSALEVLASQLAQVHPRENGNQTFLVQRSSRMSVSTEPESKGELGGIAVLLGCVAGVVLLIACLNIANMLLARGAARRKEFAVRLALGGSRQRILRQLLTETLLLSLLGGVLGLFLAYWGNNLLMASIRPLLPFDLFYRTAPDLRVLAGMLAFCTLSALIAGLGPAWRLSRPGVLADLKEHAGEDAVVGRHGLFSMRNLLVIAQLALALALLVAAGLFVRGALKAANVDPGFTVDSGVIIEMDPRLAGYNEARSRELCQAVLERLRALPGVEAASVAATVPFGTVSLGREVRLAGDNADEADPATAGKRVGARVNSVGSDYFKALGLQLLRGRAFTPIEAETGSAYRVAIIDERLAKRLWPGEDPLGKRIQFGGGRRGEKAQEIEIVGVAPDIVESLFRKGARPHVFVPFGQDFRSNMNIHVRLAPRGKESESALLRAIRREIRAVDAHLPVVALGTFRQHLESSLDLWIVRTGARLFSVFGAVALFLAVVGIYGVRSYTVARRTREIGIRIALGASSADALLLVLREGLLLTLTGIALGTLLAMAGGRLLGSLLYEVSGTDPLVLLGAPVLLSAVSLAACYMPARRAARVDPIVALRHE